MRIILKLLFIIILIIILFVIIKEGSNGSIVPLDTEDVIVVQYQSSYCGTGWFIWGSTSDRNKIVKFITLREAKKYIESKGKKVIKIEKDAIDDEYFFYIK